jgi:hypothetical protein
MIIRRATQVVAGTTMPRSATRWLPRASPEGFREAGIGQRRGCQTARRIVGALTARCGIASSFGRNCSALRGAPRSVARGAPRSGDRAAEGMPDRVKNCRVAYSPLRGRIFLRKKLLNPSRCVPERRPRGPAKRGSGSGGDVKTAPRTCWVAYSPLRGHIFLRKKLLRPSRAPQSAAQGAPQSGDRAAAGMPDRAKNCRGAYSPLRGRIFLRKKLLRPSRCAPERRPRGPAKRDRAAAGCQIARRIVGALTARYGVASSFGRHCSALRGLFASSPFAHPIPQSRRRASGDLFRASLNRPGGRIRIFSQPEIDLQSKLF